VKRIRPASTTRRAAALAALAAVILVAAWTGWQRLAERRADEAIREFLAHHWSSPIAPQGEVPAAFAPAEASLAPEDCGACHAAQWTDWKSSLHSRAVGPGILWQLRAIGQVEGNDCLRCHAPLAEQKALMALELGWPRAPAAPAPSWVPGDLHRQGVVCAACHVRRHERFGPAARAASARPGNARPHGGFTASAAFSDSRFCSPCHQFPPDGRQVNGKLLENTFEEWRASRFAREGRPCQSCHMPDRRHLWRGIHDPLAVEGALQRGISVLRVDSGRLKVTVSLANRGAGHHLPTYVVPKLFVRVRPLDGAPVAPAGEYTIGRTLDVALAKEQSDTRLAPDGRHEYAFDLPAGPGPRRIALEVEVAPAEQYERAFTEMRRASAGLDPAARALLDEALARATASRYRLTDVVVAVPAAPGERTHAESH
jgi:hypothetical protein